MDAPDRTDRRATARLETPYRLGVSGGEGSLDGYLLDLSRDGMRVCFACDEDLAELDRLRLEVPTWVDEGGPIELTGHFVWLKPSGNHWGRVGGFAFDSPAAETVQRLDRVLEGVRRAAVEDGLLEEAPARRGALRELDVRRGA